MIVIFDDRIIVPGEDSVQGGCPAVDRDSLLGLLRENIGKLLQGKTRKEQVAIVLPPLFFQLTPFDLPGIDKRRIRSALPLQLPAIFPGSDTNHLLAYMDFNYTDGQGVALWMEAELADDIVAIFESYRMDIHCIVPRPLAYIETSDDVLVVEDEDSYQKTLVHVENGKILSWYSLAALDCDDDVFVDEYLSYKDKLLSSVGQASGDFCLKINRHSIADLNPASHIVFFVPERYRISQNAKNRLKIVAALAIFLFFVVVLSSYPFVALYFKEKEIVDNIERLQRENADIVKYSDAITRFDEKWGVISEFPYINVYDLLATLDQTIPRDTWLSTLSLDNGVLELIGYSPDPEKILILLTGLEIFEDVSYSQVVRSGTREHTTNYFGIQCRIKDMDVLSYLDKYFQPASID